MIGRWVSLLAVRAAARILGRMIRALAIVALIIAAAPVSLAAALSVAGAWLAGWPPARLGRGAAWCAPMIAVWLAGTGLAARDWASLAQAPYQAWLHMWHDGAAGAYLAAAAVIAPPAIPLGLLAGALAWSRRIQSMQTGSGGRSPATAAAFDLRQWRHQVRTARARITAPGSVPLSGPRGEVVAGAVIRAVGHRPRQIAAIPYQRMRSHQVIVGTTGTGKTTLLLRLWAGFMASALSRHASGGGPPPLLVVLDCKGGADARRIADRARRVLRAAGAASTAIWPDEASLSLWALPPGQLITTLVDLVEHGTGGAAYYADVMEAMVTLAVQAPAGPPQDTADFLARLDPGWLTMAYSAGGYDEAHALIRAAGRQTGDIALRYRALFRRLGAGLDGPGSFADADAWYCILEGTAEISVAEGQARALVDLLASFAAAGPNGPGAGPGGAGPGGAGPGGAAAGRREILLAVDEFSAVSRRLPVWQLYERARSLGLAVQVSSQSWQGLAAEEDERYRIATAADGGIWLLRTPHPEPVAALAGHRTVTESARQLRGASAWDRRGTSQSRLIPVVDPALIRALDVGQAAYIYRGGTTYVQVKRLVAPPAAVSRPRVQRGDLARPQAGSLPQAGLAAPGGLVPPGERVPAQGGTPPGDQVRTGLTAWLDETFGPEVLP